ncbi:MAG: metallophosphoesterase, partial [Oscillospiraceae bacterium]|nr:metallophosphoesterase [Oscillospiraceae bacterium]
MKKFLLWSIFPLFFLFCAVICIRNTVFADYQVIVASDLHYIAPELTDGGRYYQRVLENGDSKFMPYIQEITDSFFAEVIDTSPDALLLTGDLTFNGAILSHEALIEKLAAVEDAGVPVFVLTGNHDVYNSNAARYQG